MTTVIEALNALKHTPRGVVRDDEFTRLLWLATGIDGGEEAVGALSRALSLHAHGLPELAEEARECALSNIDALAAATSAACGHVVDAAERLVEGWGTIDVLEAILAREGGEVGAVKYAARVAWLEVLCGGFEVGEVLSRAYLRSAGEDVDDIPIRKIADGISAGSRKFIVRDENGCDLRLKVRTNSPRMAIELNMEANSAEIIKRLEARYPRHIVAQLCAVGEF